MIVCRSPKHTFMWLTVIVAVFFLLAWLVTPALAQEDAPRVSDIAYDNVVEDLITDAAFFDWWRVQASQGDQMVIDMAAGGGLEPQIGLLDAAGELVANQEGAADSTITVEYTVPKAGVYTIVATRVGRDQGTTTGSYSLRLRRANAPAALSNNMHQDVTFRCEDYEVTTAATLRFADDPVEGQVHRITVYGEGGFQPVIRLRIETQPDFNLCNTDAQHTVDDVYTLPGQPPRTIAEADTAFNSQLGLRGANEMGQIAITIGSKDGAAGRYVAIVDGFNIDPASDNDEVEVRIGPLAAKTTSMSVYMVAAANSRLDPFIQLPGQDRRCDDAGRRECADVPSFAGSGYTLHEGGITTVKGDRQDAGILLAPGNPDPIILELGSRGGETAGGYVLVITGELPPRP